MDIVRVDLWSSWRSPKISILFLFVFKGKPRVDEELVMDRRDPTSEERRTVDATVLFGLQQRTLLMAEESFFFAIFRQKRVALKGSSSFRSLYLLSLRWIDYQQNWGNQINKNTPKFDLEAVDRDQHSFMRLPLVLDWVLVGNCNIVWCRFWLDFDYLIASSLYHSRSTRNSRQDWVSSYFFSFLIEIFSILSKVTSK